MQQTRRQTFEAIRAGPALFAGLPGDEVDIDRLMTHLAARGFEGGVCVSDRAGDGVLWIRHGDVDEAWFFDASGHEAVLPGVYGHDLLRDIAARGGVVGVVVGAPEAEPPVMFPSAPPEIPQAPVPAPALQPEPVVPTPLPGAEQPAIPEPPAHPWPEILQEVAARVVRHRGPRLAALFTSALAKALAGHGGTVEGDRITAPPLPESAWRVIVESACAPIVSIAGRAFTDRTIAAAERAIRAGDAGGGEGE